MNFVVENSKTVKATLIRPLKTNILRRREAGETPTREARWHRQAVKVKRPCTKTGQRRAARQKTKKIKRWPRASWQAVQGQMESLGHFEGGRVGIEKWNYRGASFEVRWSSQVALRAWRRKAIRSPAIKRDSRKSGPAKTSKRRQNRRTWALRFGRADRGLT